MTDSDDNVVVSTGDFTPMKRLLMSTITTIWRGDAREGLDPEFRRMTTGEAWHDYKVTLQLIIDADDELVRRLQQLPEKPLVTRHDLRRVSIHFVIADLGTPSRINPIVRGMVRNFYERHNVP